MIDIDDIDTPTWLREQRTSFIERARTMCWGRGIGETVAPTPGGLFDVLIERTLWLIPDPHRFDREFKVSVNIERSTDDQDAMNYSIIHRNSADKCMPRIVVGWDMAEVAVKQ